MTKAEFKIVVREVTIHKIAMSTNCVQSLESVIYQ